MAQKMLKHIAAMTISVFFFLSPAFAVEWPAFDAGDAAFGYGVGQTQPSDLASDPADSCVPPAGSEEETEFDDFGEFSETVPVVVSDPLGGYNRFMTEVNDSLYVWVFRPVAKGYRLVVIKPVRLAIARVFTNASYPVRFVNNLLQLKIRRAGEETGRFIVNTTLGVGGLFDPATTCMEISPWPEDFGQTLGHYGLGGGYHIVLPLLGPSNLRDAVSLFPDSFLQPVNYIDDTWTAVAVSGTNRLNTLSLFIDEYDDLRAEALDLYIFQRDAYEMKRKKEIGE